jgi:flagellar biosynthesis/type III secretory pathway protein FliH
MTEQEVTKVLKDIEEASRRGYAIGYAEGYRKGKDPYSIDNNTLNAVITYMIEHYKEKYTNGLG